MVGKALSGENIIIIVGGGTVQTESETRSEKIYKKGEKET